MITFSWTLINEVSRVNVSVNVNEFRELTKFRVLTFLWKNYATVDVKQFQKSKRLTLFVCPYELLTFDINHPQWNRKRKCHDFLTLHANKRQKKTVDSSAIWTRTFGNTGPPLYQLSYWVPSTPFPVTW